MPKVSFININGINKLSLETVGYCSQVKRSVKVRLGFITISVKSVFFTNKYHLKSKNDMAWQNF